MALERMQSIDQRVAIDGSDTRMWVDYRAARPGLWIFGAGDDAKPLLRLARELGWFAAVADGRSHLATRERFPSADKVLAFLTIRVARSRIVVPRGRESDRCSCPADSQLRTGFADTRRLAVSVISFPPILAYLDRSAEPAKFWPRPLVCLDCRIRLNAWSNGSRRCTHRPASIWARKHLPPSRSRSLRKFNRR